MHLLEKLNLSLNTMWWGIITLLILVISYFHFTLPPSQMSLHLILMQFYIVPILIGAVQFGVIGGFGAALVASFIVAPHIIFQWMGGPQYHFVGYLQIVIFNAIGYLTGLKVQIERKTRDHLTQTAIELTGAMKQLEQQSTEISEMEEQLRHSERLSVIGELMASLAHELRNPLASIRGSVEILNKELDEQEKRGEFFQILVDETERMSGVVENYLALARRSKGLDIKYDAVEIVRNSCLMLGSRARKNQINIKYTVPSQPFVIQGDPNDLRQVMVNILLNAIQAMEQAGKILVKAVIQTEPDQQESSTDARASGKFLEIRIEDEGLGIKAEKLDEIFQPFYSTKSEGTGLGLSIVKRIVDSRQWEIKAEKRVPVGTIFILRIC